MKILALETSALAASAAVCEDERLIAQSFQATGLTHSRTLLPMVEDLLKNTDLTLEGIDVIAVAAGPGSFTGLRIGVAAAKGLAWPAALPCAGVSTLEAMAWGLAHVDGELCCAMDARRAQVYSARFCARGGALSRLTEDRAISLEELAAEVKRGGAEQLVVGDGAQLCCEALRAAGIPVRKAPPHLVLPSAWGVARAALEQARRGALISAQELAPRYHRLSQAERERLAQKQKADA